MTSLPLILAEELDADWAKVRVVVAPPNDALYKNPGFGYMYTAGSNAVTSYFTELRQFGAQAEIRNAIDGGGDTKQDQTTQQPAKETVAGAHKVRWKKDQHKTQPHGAGTQQHIGAPAA